MRDDATSSDRVKPAKSGNGEMSGLGWWTEGSQRALDGWARSNSSLLKGTLDMAQEVVAFSQTRLNANASAWAALISCRSPDDLIKIQQTFAQTAATDCLNEASKLTTQMVGILCGAAKCFGEQPASR